MLKDARATLRLAYQIAAEFSDDPSTQCGAIVVRDGVELARGVNHMPHPSFCNDPANFERPYKYKLIEHAERDAVYQAARDGVSLLGATLFAPWAACADCARAIALSGIKKVVAHAQAYDQTPQRWREEIEIGLKIFDACGVTYTLYEEKIGDVENLFDGRIWHP